ncbi:hypothetical protein PM082_007938 [Marasmius tenuissimus]|nr:hypothetical protein PM082_007938 [Marasmius tenuissimus]
MVDRVVPFERASDVQSCHGRPPSVYITLSFKQRPPLELAENFSLLHRLQSSLACHPDDTGKIIVPCI